ncbi:MAG: hypothetical protein MJ219_03695 [Mycoplasmoidaceae bacterium]|nr:hypothetical protein [Mycoplasmoidaceae bacterium]
MSYVKTEFIKNVFAQNYYGFASNGVDPQYPFIKTSSTMTPTKLEIGNPEN